MKNVKTLRQKELCLFLLISYRHPILSRHPQPTKPEGFGEANHIPLSASGFTGFLDLQDYTLNFFLPQSMYYRLN